MKHTQQVGFFENRLLRFAGGETPSMAPEPKHPEEKNGKFAYESWKDFTDWLGAKGNDGIISMTDDMLKDGDLGVVLPNGEQVFPKAYWDAKNEVPLKDGMKLSYERGVIGADGKPVDARIVSAKVYPSREILDRHVLQNSPDIRLRAEMKTLRPQIDTHLFFARLGASWVDGLAEAREDLRALMEKGDYEGAAEKVKFWSDFTWEATKKERMRYEGKEAPGRDENPYRLHYSVANLRTPDGTVDPQQVQFIYSDMERDMQAIGLDYTRKQSSATREFDRYDALRTTLIDRAKKQGKKPDFEPDESEWYARVKGDLYPDR